MKRSDKKKVVDAKTKNSLQSSSKTREIDFKYLKSYKLLIKKNKKYKVNQKHWDRDKNKAKSYNLSFANS